MSLTSAALRASRLASVKHERGILYVAWLLTHPPAEPIHAIDLVAQVPAIYRRQLGITAAVDDATGRTVPFAATAMPRDRSHAIDDLAVARRIRAEGAHVAPRRLWPDT